MKELVVGHEKIDHPLPQQNAGNLLKRALERTSNKSMQNKPWRKLGVPDVSKVAMICSMYHAILQTLSQLKLDILSGLCYNDAMIHDLFLFIASLGPTCGLKPMLELLTLSSENLSPPLLLLMLFCDMMTHYVT